MPKTVMIDGVEYVPKVEEPEVIIAPRLEAKLTAKTEDEWIEQIAGLQKRFGKLTFSDCHVEGVLQAGKYTEISLSFETWDYDE